MKYFQDANNSEIVSANFNYIKDGVEHEGVELFVEKNGIRSQLRIGKIKNHGVYAKIHDVVKFNDFEDYPVFVENESNVNLENLIGKKINNISVYQESWRNLPNSIITVMIYFEPLNSSEDGYLELTFSTDTAFSKLTEEELLAFIEFSHFAIVW
jgi:hypothetical protein